MKSTKSLLSLSAITLITISSFQTAFAEKINLSLTQESAKIAANNSSFKPGLNRVTFESMGEKMVGNLYLPPSYKQGERLPVIVVTGAWTTVKEQMPAVYAQRLSERGFAAFTFDFRYWGESGGLPRQYESPTAKVEDIKNAVTFIKSLPSIDSERIGGLGICASSGYMAQAVAENPDFKAFATVAAWLHDPQSLEAVFGAETVQRRMELGKAAEEKYKRTGEVDYVLAYDQKDQNAAMSGDVSYYGSAERGVIPEWTNRFAVMSWHQWQSFNALTIASKIQVPTLIVHSDGSALPDGAKKFYNTLGTTQKQLFWIQGQHLDFYDRDPQVSIAVEALTEHFQKTL